MVGRLMVEDEYTINVKVRRPLGEEACLAPPTITITPDSSLITLTPPDNSTLTYAHASKSVNGSTPMAVGCSTLPRSSASSRGSWATLPHPSRHAAGAKPSGSGLEVALASKADPPARNYVGLSLNKSLGKQVYGGEEALALRQQQIMPPPPPERRAPPGPLPLTAPRSPCSPDLPLSPPASVTHGCLPLPIIQVFADDSSHVATNRFVAPPRAVSPHEGVRRQGSPRPVDRAASHTAAGCLYVPRIPEHCKSDNGMLYVPPVDEQNLRQSKKDGPPAKGNSRRRKAIEASPDSQALTPTGAPALLPGREHASSDVLARTPPDAVPPRTASSKAAARALLAGVLGPRMDLGSPDGLGCNTLNSNRNYCNIEFRSPSPRQTLRQICYNNDDDDDDSTNNNRNNQYLAEESYNNSLNTYKSNRPSPFSSPGKRSPENEGERVVEVYGGVTNHAHAPPTTVSGRSGHVDPAHPQLVDPALLTSLDLESDHAAPAHEMLVTDAPHSTRPHDLNHNNHAFGHKSSEDHVSGRAAKYMVAESGDLAGHDNYAFDHDILSGQDNYGYDPGYSSERSPEDEEGPPLYCSSSSPASSSAAAVAQRERSPREPRDRNSLKVAPGEIINTLEVMRLVPFITESTTFQVTVIKNLRGLGLAVTGGIECDLPYAGLIRIKKLYPQTPAWLCGQLEVGDILLQANDNPLTGLTSHEALEMLRTVGQEVTLEICRPPPGTMGDGEDLPDGGNTLGVVSTSLTTPNTSHNYLSPSPSFSSCGEFEVQLTKVAGSLGFTLRKQDNSILGHTIRSLVKEPAISDGRLRPGDKIISVNNTDMCSLSHEEAIGFLRTCPETVTLRLYRDAMQTPVSPVSPTEPDILAKPKPLRKEARDMLSDLAFRKQSPSNSPSLAGASGSPGTPRRRRLQKTPSPDIKSVVIDRWDSLVRKTEESLPGTPTLEKKTSLNSIRETDHEVSPFGDSQTDDSLSTTIRSRNSSASSSSLTASNSESRPKRPSFLDLSNGRGCPRKTQFTPPHEVDRSFPSPLGGNYPSADSLDSAPQLTSAHSDTPAFSHLQQGYQSVNLGALHPHEDSRLTNTTSDHNISSHDTDGPQQSGLLKWKGIVFTPEEEDTQSLEESLQQEGDREGSPQSHKPKMVTIELNRGWNSRLGFSLQPKGENTVIKAIYADSVAAKDGRLKMGDIVVKVNGIDVVGWETESVIDLLRKTRGKISVTVLQPLS